MYSNGVSTKLSKCCSAFHIGGTPSRKESKYFLQGNHTWVSIADMSKNIGCYITDSKEKVTDLATKETILSEKLTKKGMVLFSFKLTIGKVSIAGTDLYTNEAIASLQPNINILSSEYLYYALKNTNNDFLPSNSKAFGKSLNSDSVVDLDIKIIPSITEQNKIIEKLNKFYSDIQSLESTIVSLEDYSKIIESNLI